MDNIILFLILFIFIILLSNHSIEGFEVDTCNMNDKINTFIFGEGKKYDTHKENLKEEVIQGQIEENIQSDDKEKEEEKENKLYQILTNINENLKIITLKLKEEEEEEKEEEEEEEESKVYSRIINLDSEKTKKYLINTLFLIVFIIFIVVFFYSMYILLEYLNKRRKISIRKIDTPYEDILDEIKKNKIKGKFKFKKIKK